MAAEPARGDFDANPPVPVSEYEQTVRRVNVGYELVFTLTTCLLRAIARPTLKLLAVGAGGGAEIEQFLPGNLGWRITGVDPSQDMLALARSKAERLGVAERTTLIRGTVPDIPLDDQFDAATCIFVLHFLPDQDKLALLRSIKERIHANAPLLVVTGAEPDDGGLGDDLVGSWQQYGEATGMPAERMRAIIEQIMSHPRTPQQEYVRLLKEAGFERVASYFSVLGGGICAWIAR